MGITRRDFMKGVGGLVGLGFLGLGNGGDCRRDVGWSEEIEDEARLRNEVGDLMREWDVIVYCHNPLSDTRGHGVYTNKNIVYGDCSIDFFRRTKKKLSSVGESPFECFHRVVSLFA